jgi:hypothetical protein
MKKENLLEVEMKEDSIVDSKTFIPYKEGHIRFNVEKMTDIWNNTLSSYGNNIKIRNLHKEIMEEFSNFLMHWLTQGK